MKLTLFIIIIATLSLSVHSLNLHKYTKKTHLKRRSLPYKIFYNYKDPNGEYVGKGSQHPTVEFQNLNEVDYKKYLQFNPMLYFLTQYIPKCFPEEAVNYILQHTKKHNFEIEKFITLILQVFKVIDSDTCYIENIQFTPATKEPPVDCKNCPNILNLKLKLKFIEDDKDKKDCIVDPCDGCPKLEKIKRERIELEEEIKLKCPPQQIIQEEVDNCEGCSSIISDLKNQLQDLEILGQTPPPVIEYGDCDEAKCCKDKPKDPKDQSGTILSPYFANLYIYKGKKETTYPLTALDYVKGFLEFTSTKEIANRPNWIVPLSSSSNAFKYQIKRAKKGPKLFGKEKHNGFYLASTEKGDKDGEIEILCADEEKLRMHVQPFFKSWTKYQKDVDEYIEKIIEKNTS